jgi:hypothetical protein
MEQVGAQHTFTLLLAETDVELAKANSIITARAHSWLPDASLAQRQLDTRAPKVAFQYLSVGSELFAIGSNPDGARSQAHGVIIQNMRRTTAFCFLFSVFPPLSCRNKSHAISPPKHYLPITFLWKSIFRLFRPTN